MRYTDIDIAVVEALIRDALPRATEAEVAAQMEQCEGRTLNLDNADLLRPFGPRNRESNRVDRDRATRRVPAHGPPQRLVQQLNQVGGPPAR